MGPTKPVHVLLLAPVPYVDMLCWDQIFRLLTCSDPVFKEVAELKKKKGEDFDLAFAQRESLWWWR